MADLTPHAQEAVALLNERTYSAHELRLKLKVNGVKFAHTMTTLYEKGVVERPRGFKGEGLTLTERGRDLAASLAVVAVLTEAQ